MAKLHKASDTVIMFHCPGCQCAHGISIEPGRWTWNGSEDKPTFFPSILCNKDYLESRCHSFVTDGKIQFLDDCFHDLKNKVMEIPDWEF